MKRSASLIILVAGTLFASCSSLQTISFDQLQAADVSFPDAVRKVAVINNMPVLKTKDNHEILSSELEGDGKVASEALAENIANVNYFDQVIICDSVFRAQDKVPRVNVILTKEEVRKLSEDLGVDMILSFDRIHIQTKPGVLFYPDFPMPIDAVDGIISPIVRVYIPNRDKPLFVVAKQDTISWEIEPALSDRKIVKEASEYAASIPVEHLLPHWDEVARFYYDGGNIEMRDAGVYLRENNWDEAYSQWKIAYEKRKGQQSLIVCIGKRCQAEISGCTDFIYQTARQDAVVIVHYIQIDVLYLQIGGPGHQYHNHARENENQLGQEGVAEQLLEFLFNEKLYHKTIF